MISRRRALLACSLGIVGAAGCLADEPELDPDETAATEDGTDESAGSEDGSTAPEDEEPVAVDPEAPLVTTRERDLADGDERDAGDELVLATYGDVATVSEIEESYRRPGYEVAIEFTAPAAEAFVDRLESVGALEEPQERELFLYLEGERFDSHRLGPSLADAMRSGDWDGEFLIPADDRATLETFRAQFESA